MLPERLDLTGFAEIPGDPAYRIHPDGRVASLKKTLPAVLTERRASNPRLSTVRLGGVDVRVRDLLVAVFGTAHDYYERIEDWS
ncbi:hypothetical protein GCM10009785_19870 [Brooklawnia cerclae]|uniref:Uncharacterized protein n=1 Tax=Brooklawnia cerclae TaxID=349934 RepID=A0ABX0SH45_9ACTN|nr:hypothetical protein [Brooklawnia cerclae]NIH57271.1 hypothetical protein [Brooklawnia cerclae]